MVQQGKGTYTRIYPFRRRFWTVKGGDTARILVGPSLSALIASMHDQWLHNYRCGKSQVVTCFDLSAAFDTLSSDIFCSKLKLYGFDKKSVNWFKTYMQNRKQVVMIGATISDQITTNLGSPQGAIISTTIFIILIADISLWS